VLWLYNAILPAATWGARLAAPWNDKLRHGLSGRRAAAARLVARAPQLRGRAVWFHTTSVGEYEQARPLVALLHERRPHLEVLHTFFSPSGHGYASRLGEAAHVEYLPDDTRRVVGDVLDALQPQLLVFVKFDLWPNLIVEAHRRCIPTILIDATLQPRSLRSRWPARALYRGLYRRLACISAVSENDAARFRALVPEHPAIVVDGDTRFDQVMRRRREAERVELPACLQTKPRPFTFIAGSTWGPDEDHVVAAWRALRSTSRNATSPRLIVVPHEPTPRHLARLEKQLAAAQLGSCRLSQLDALATLAADVVLVDRVGVLAELYAHADAAYVGGAFTTGVHNVMEPAIAALPVLFGPRHHNAPEAEMLLESEAAAVIGCAADLERQLHTLTGNDSARSRMGGRARAFVEANQGASERCMARVDEVLEAPLPRAKECP
jgi:3-deoxy-D-manno-octulosonic-acid transferase